MIFVINNLKYDTTKMELISIKCEYKYTGTMLCYDTLLSYSELSDAKYNAIDTILNTLTGAYYSTLLLKNKEKL